MSFINTFFLFAISAAVLPVLFHFVRKMKAKKVPFGSLMFLKATPKELIKKRRLRDLLLMTLRAAIFGLLAFAFARPFIPRTKGISAVVLPVLFHFVRKMKAKKVPFGSLMFLKATPKELIKKRRLRDLLLMALRAAIFGLLAFAFARPFIPKGRATAQPSHPETVSFINAFFLLGISAAVLPVLFHFVRKMKALMKDTVSGWLVQFQAIPRAMRFRDTSRSESGKRRAKSDFRTSLPALHPPLSDAATLRKARFRRDCTEDSLKLH